MNDVRLLTGGSAAQIFSDGIHDRVKSHLPATNQDPKAQRQDDALMAKCRQIESLFVFQLLKTMRSTLPADGLLNGGSAHDTYASMLDHQRASHVAENGSIGLAAVLFRQLSASRDAAPVQVGHADETKSVQGS